MGIHLKAEALEKDDAPASLILATVISELGMDSLEWEPETLEMEIKDVFGVDIPRNNLDKLLALISAITREHFYTDYKAFESIVKALNDDDPSPDRIVETTPEEIVWAITEVLDADPDPVEWDEDVKAYIQAVFQDYGYLTLPDDLSFIHYSGGSVPSAFSPKLKEKIESEQRLKHLRIKTYKSMKKDLRDKYSKYLR